MARRSAGSSVPPTRPRRAVRWALPGCGPVLVGCVLAGSMLGIAAWQSTRFAGWWHPVRILSGSMAPAWRGPHWMLVCRECGGHFSVGREHAPRDGAICPWCGAGPSDLIEGRLLPGDRVLVDERPRQFQRWEAVAYDQPGQTHWAVKRLLGLPGETVAFKDGDLWIDGRRQAKSLAQFRALAVLVSDSRIRPPQLPPAWTATDGWQIKDGVLQLLPSASDFPADSSTCPIGGSTSPGGERPVHWTSFEHRNVLATVSPPQPRGALSPIWDVYSYNQSLARSQLAEVHDLLLGAWVRWPTKSDALLLEAAAWSRRLLLQAHGRGLIVELWGPADNAHGRAGLRATRPTNDADSFRRLRSWQLTDQQLSAALLSSPPLDGTEHYLELAVVDRQLLLGLDGQQLLALPLGESAPRSDEPPFRIGAIGPGHWRISRVQVWRDLYYRGVYEEPEWSLGRPLDDDEYFLVGDNVPASRDCRHQRRGISQSSLRALVLDRWP